MRRQNSKESTFHFTFLVLSRFISGCLHHLCFWDALGPVVVVHSQTSFSSLPQQQKRVCSELKKTSSVASGELVLTYSPLLKWTATHMTHFIVMHFYNFYLCVICVYFPERKMKPLLPRTDSYLVPIQLPLASPLFLPSSGQFSLPASQPTSSSYGAGKRVRIAPKVKL